jgi:hypothetical protein
MNFRKPEYDGEFITWVITLILNIVIVSILISSYGNFNYQQSIYDFKPCEIFSPNTVVSSEFLSPTMPRYTLPNTTRTSTCYRIKGEVTPIFEGTPMEPLAVLIPVSIVCCLLLAGLSWRLFVAPA